MGERVKISVVHEAVFVQASHRRIYIKALPGGRPLRERLAGKIRWEAVGERLFCAASSTPSPFPISPPRRRRPRRGSSPTREGTPLVLVSGLGKKEQCAQEFGPSRREDFSSSLRVASDLSVFSRNMVAVEMGLDAAIDDAAQIPKDAKKILHNLASRWSDVADCRALEVVPLKGAMTNEVYQINWPSDEVGAPPRKVLVRIYGEGVDVFFDRHDEIRTFECMSQHGQGPRLLGRFSNGRVEEFIHARTLSAADLRDPEISALIAAKLREFHNLRMPGSKNILLWDRLRRWLKAAKGLASPEEASEFSLDKVEEEITSLEKELSMGNQMIGFCHNDLQYGNIMIDEESRSVTIIDYEYASYNPVAYDFANHFCEMTADYHTETPHVLDFSKYPDFEERKRFVQHYLTSGDELDGVELEKLLADIEKYTLASHLVWGLWGIISEHVNDIDFDYMGYARQRFQQYWLRKPLIFGTRRASQPGE